ncbi:MAG: hypothetical protein SGPRY_009858 [Prymnesium sp.]
MLWEIGSTTIINLTNENDSVGSGPNDKRERYWPPYEYAEVERAALSWPVSPQLLGTEQCRDIPSVLRYAILLQGPPDAHGTRPERIVSLYWYTEWIDFPDTSFIGTPPFFANARHVLHLAAHIARELEAKGKRSHKERWGVCHCSAGVGRTGTFIGILHMLIKLPSITSEAALDRATAAVIESMRARRLWMVKTDVEYATLYAALLFRLVRAKLFPLTAISAHPLTCQLYC